VYNPKILERINPTIVKQYSYCPVIPWIQVKLNIYEPLTDSMRIAVENTHPPSGRGQVYVRGSRGSAIIDEIVEDEGGRVIVERKAYRSHNYSRYVEQAVSTYLIAKSVIPGIRRIKLVVGDRDNVIDINEDLAADVERILDLIEKSLNSDKPPSTSTNPKKCGSCWYRRYCPHY
jgi:CRISPR-associated exonuclease Cas4